MKRNSNHMKHFRELSIGARQYGKYGELVLELCAWNSIESRVQRKTCRYQGKA